MKRGLTKLSSLTVCHNDDDAKRLEMRKPPLPLLPTLLVLVLPDGFGRLALDRTLVVLRLLCRCQTGLIGFASTFGKVADFRSYTRLEV